MSFEHRVQRGQAIKILSSGIIVKLEDSREGFLPRREFALAGTRDLRQVFQLGHEFQVICEDGGETTGERVLLQLVLEDQWGRLAVEYPPGTTVTGLVTAVELYGVFVSLLPGVTGLAPREELAEGTIGRIEETVWVGDIVRCVVQSISQADRRVRLSIKAAAAARSDFLQTGKFLESPMSLPATPVAPVVPLAARPQVRPLRILIVDDESGVRDQLAEHLHHSGHAAEKADSAASARAILSSQVFDVVILDISMPVVSGLQMAEQLLQMPNHPRIILMTDWGKAVMLDAEIEPLLHKGADLITKPHHEVELDQLLLAYYGKSPRREPRERSRRFHDGATCRFRSNLERTVQSILAELRERTGAGQLAVFYFNAPIQRLNVLAFPNGGRWLREKELQTHWRYSPIRDVLEDGAVVQVTDVRESKVASRFKYLLRILDFAACIGVPVRTEIPAALFIFHKEPQRFKSAHRQLVRAAAERIAAALDRHLMEKTFTEQHRYMLLGQLGAVVVHEINNKLGSVNWNTRRLPDDLRALERRLSDGSELEIIRPLWHKAYDHSQTLAKAMDDLLKITKGLDNLIRTQEARRLNVHQVINQAIEACAPLAKEANVVFHTQFNHPAPYVIGVEAWLQQTFLNTLLNAIQQIQERKVRQKGHILITTREDSPQSSRGLQVRIYDDGPGIHTALWGRVFNLSFTTRERGSGIGLFVTRNLIESLGGRVSIEESHVLWGTTILIELPVTVAEEGDVDV